jgi:hypothetical protein
MMLGIEGGDERGRNCNNLKSQREFPREYETFSLSFFGSDRWIVVRTSGVHRDAVTVQLSLCLCATGRFLMKALRVTTLECGD